MTRAPPCASTSAALSHGWTSISEQWVDRARLHELEDLATQDALPLRVDAYLALNGRLALEWKLDGARVQVQPEPARRQV